MSDDNSDGRIRMRVLRRINSRLILTEQTADLVRPMSHMATGFLCKNGEARVLASVCVASPDNRSAR